MCEFKSIDKIKEFKEAILLSYQTRLFSVKMRRKIIGKMKKRKLFRWKVLGKRAIESSWKIQRPDKIKSWADKVRAEKLLKWNQSESQKANHEGGGFKLSL